MRELAIQPDAPPAPGSGRAVAQAIRGVTNAEEVFDRTATGIFWLDLPTLYPVRARIKRLLDVVLSASLLAILSPLFAVIALLVRSTSRGPALFRQRRIGFRCSEFGMLKFRTMTIDAESKEEHLAEQAGGAFLKLEKDPRVTTVGRWLRRSSLDELPQLLNVLDGSMSLVGPRPLLPSDLRKFARRGQMRRFSMRPGITGLWQVSGRSLLSDEERMRLDREYVSRWSLGLDLKILMRTVGVVLTGKGSY